jgi:ATP-dependent exoDNAse (exonuclease V) beta subunit
MLENLRNTPLLDEIEAAALRYTEVPFTLSTRIGQLHGVIDLLFQDRERQWHLIDWKTDWLPVDEIEVQALQHRRQIAIYVAAVKQVLGVEPRARLCFLALQGRTHAYTPEELGSGGSFA